MSNFPITPPPELVQQWIQEADGGHDPRWQEYEQDIATRAAQWGADQELEACCEYIHRNWGGVEANALRAARRPKLKSTILAEQALAAARIELSPNGKNGVLIIKALERLQKLESNG